MNTRSYLYPFVIGSAAVLAGCAQQPAQTEAGAPAASAQAEPSAPEAAAMATDRAHATFAPAPVGTVWRYAVVRDGREWVETHTHARQGTYEGRPAHFVTMEPSAHDPGFPCHGATANVYDAANGSWMACLDGETELASATPSNGSLAWPLAPGKSWQARYTWSDPTVGGFSGNAAVTREASWEEVTVPHGTIGAYRIVTKSPTWEGRPDTTWGETLWYAPELGVPVRYEAWRKGATPYGVSSVTSELLDYTSLK